jgi:hypothetical protein
MGGSNFELIAQELLRYRDIMQELQAENRWLRQKLADLRAGRGITLVIEGKPIPLHVSADSVSQITQKMIEQSALRQAAPLEDTPITYEHSPAQQQRTTIPLPPEEVKKGGQTTFLEEIMLDEFSAATGSSKAIWQDPTTKKEIPQKPESTDEDEMAALRRDLIGSFLLE